MTATVLASIALVVAALALILAGLVMRQSADSTADLRRHRRAHAEAFGNPDPRLDRRQVNLGAPRAGERRGTRYEPPPERLAPPAMVTVDDPLDRAHAERLAADYEQRWHDEVTEGTGAGQPAGLIPPEPSSPTSHRDPDDEPTGQLPAAVPPTTMIAAQRPDPPPRP